MISEQDSHLALPIQEHLNDLTARATLLFFSLAIASAVWLTQINDILLWLITLLDPCEIECMNVYNPAEWSAVRWLSSAILGLITIVPLLIHQTWSFSKSGLYSNERTWLLTWMFLCSGIVLALVSLTLGYLFPLVFEYGHQMQSSMGLSAQYDAVLMLNMAVSVVWIETVVACAVFAMILAGKTGILNESTADWWRLRVYGIVILLLLASMPEAGNIAIFISLFLIMLIEFTSKRWLTAAIREVE